MHLPNLHFVILLLYNNLINIFYFQEAFSQSDFQKGLELNKQIYKKTCIYYITRKILKKYTGKVQRLLKKFLLNVEILVESFIFLSKLFQSVMAW
jgi:hypothetical protein